MLNLPGGNNINTKRHLTSLMKRNLPLQIKYRFNILLNAKWQRENLALIGCNNAKMVIKFNLNFLFS